MVVENNGSKEKSNKSDGKKNSDPNKPVDLIASKLRNFYDSVTDEGTPDFLLNLLDRLDAAENAAKSKKQSESND
ncbi:NepR family anti-sigma factor [Agrobacterium sp. ES01]|uniref:NepR family anti-sigma factor n=1 Tax=Agrobacterium sp. ES01 TaxID=3420714 RepID=UPI003D0CE1CC